jgi:hypothetical protein
LHFQLGVGVWKWLQVNTLHSRCERSAATNNPRPVEEQTIGMYEYIHGTLTCSFNVLGHFIGEKLEEKWDGSIANAIREQAGKEHGEEAAFTVVHEVLKEVSMTEPL